MIEVSELPDDLKKWMKEHINDWFRIGFKAAWSINSENDYVIYENGKNEYKSWFKYELSNHIFLETSMYGNIGLETKGSSAVYLCNENGVIK